MTSKSNSPVVLTTLWGSKVTNAFGPEERFSLSGISSLQILINKSEDNVWLQTKLVAILLLTWIFLLAQQRKFVVFVTVLVAISSPFQCFIIIIIIIIIIVIIIFVSIFHYLIWIGMNNNGNHGGHTTFLKKKINITTK